MKKLNIMKKLLLLLFVFGLLACSSDSDDDNNNQQENIIRIGNQEYPIEKGVLQNWGLLGSDTDLADCPNCYELYFGFGESTLPNNYYSENYSYQGYLIDISFVSENTEPSGDFTALESDYDLTSDSSNNEVETWVGLNPGSLSVEKSGNTYTVVYSSTDDNGNIVEVYYNGGISYWED